ncbi:iron ABC transporter permease [Ktedonosporobacter rubrisoli]|uniref:Iron ABC transporter permease n=1 Tax=Ktedonosporobacter rubrisoli TaxID=2509675 RepID=A0A4P6JVT6_KTERU|nr:iron ABC transporter permease [Ktedonosporobacter rubrisoli]QBD79789.1 iron ABC transporter permease [Ktedonosporobacter rubrisoli]
MVPQQHHTVVSEDPNQDRAGKPALSSYSFSVPQLLRLGGQILVIGLPLLILALFVVYPLAAIILQSIFPNLFAASPSLAPGFEALLQLIANRQNYLALINSLWLSGVTALLASLIGTLLAILARRTDLPLRGTLDTLVWIVFFTPSFLVGEAWSLTIIHGGIPDQYLHFPAAFVTWFFSPAGVIFILSLKTFPFVYIAVSAALHWLGSEFEDAARLAGARTWLAWISINIPLLLPAILAAGLIAFAEALSDFGIAATIAQNANVTLITYQIYAAVNTAPVNFSLAAALSLLMFVAIALALLLQAAVLRTRSFQIISGKNRPARPVVLGYWKIPAVLFCGLVFLFALIIPLLMCLMLSFMHAFGQGITPGNWTLDNYTAVLAQGSDDLDAMLRTLWLALGAATITTIVGLPIAFIIRRTKLPGRKLLGLFTLVTIAVPGIILACGYIFAWNASYLQFLGIGGEQGLQFYGTIWLLFAAYIGGSLPYATRLGIGALEQIGPSMLETARVQGTNLFQLLLRIVAPLVRSSLISIWLLVFTGTMFELAASELLYPPGEPTMPVRIIGLFNTFKLGPGMALAMLNVGLVALALILFRAIPWLVSRLIQRGKRRKTGYVSTNQAVEQELRVAAGRF